MDPYVKILKQEMIISKQADRMMSLSLDLQAQKRSGYVAAAALCGLLIAGSRSDDPRLRETCHAVLDTLPMNPQAREDFRLKMGGRLG